ncbi:hypothetical protein ACQ4PT_017161 [Festuca glaucescens]
MAFSARRSLASGLSRHLTRRLHPSLPHLVPSHHDRSGDPSCSSSPPPPPPTHQPSRFPSGDLLRRSRSQTLPLPLPFGAHLTAHRNYSSGPEVDTAAGAVLSDAALPFPGEVAAAAADSFPPFAAVQHLIDAVHSFTGLNWWASIALATVLVRAATILLLVHQFKAERTFNALKPEVKAIEEDMLNHIPAGGCRFVASPLCRYSPRLHPTLLPAIAARRHRSRYVN